MFWFHSSVSSQYLSYCKNAAFTKINPDLARPVFSKQSWFWNNHNNNWCHFALLHSIFHQNQNNNNKNTVAPGGDHLISLIDEISYVSPPSPMLSQMDDIPPEQFCNGDNRPPDCGLNCMCTHTVDIPLNAIVEVVLVDEGEAGQQQLFSVSFVLFLYSFNFNFNCWFFHPSNQYNKQI